MVKKAVSYLNKIKIDILIKSLLGGKVSLKLCKLLVLLVVPKLVSALANIKE